MALDSFKTQFDNAYQDIFQKTLVALKVANLRFEPVLKYGSSIQRVLPSIDGVRVRATTRGSASTIDSLTDSTETLTVNQEYEAVFHVSDGEVTQCGPLNPGEWFGGQIAQKVSAHLDGKVFEQVICAASGFTFDQGDLTGMTSSGLGFALTTTTTPQMVSRLPAKLARKSNLALTNMAFVVDNYVASDLAQYLMGKQFDIVESVWRNGYAGNVSTAEVYVSENLMSEAVFTITACQAKGTGESLEINGVKLRIHSGTLVAGDICWLPTTTATEAGDVLAAALNDPYTSTNSFFAVVDASAALLKGSTGLSATNAAGVVTVRAIGGGRITVAENISGSAWGSPFLHCYYGKKGAIDVVVQDLAPVDMRKTSDRRGTNVFSSYLAGVKTFTDGTKKFLDVKIEYIQ